MEIIENIGNPYYVFNQFISIDHVYMFYWWNKNPNINRQYRSFRLCLTFKFVLSSFWMDIFRKNGTVSVWSQLCVVILRRLCLCSLNMHKLSNGEFDYCFRVDKQHTWLLFGILVHCRISHAFLLKCSISN